MKKNIIIINLFCILAAILLSALIEIFVFNGIKLYNIGNNKGSISLMDKATMEVITVKEEAPSEDDNDILFKNDMIESKEDEEKEIEYVDKELNSLKIKFDKIYVDRITINYKTDVDFELPLSIQTFNVYGDPNPKESKNIAFLKEFNTVTKVIENDADEFVLVLDYPSDINFEIRDIQIKNEFCFNVYRFILISIFLVTLVLLFILRKILWEKTHICSIIIIL